MTQEEKQLLLKDLCARLPYGVKVMKQFKSQTRTLMSIDVINLRVYFLENDVNSPFGFYIEDPRYCSQHIKPYLRSMSSMTEEEKETYQMFFNEDGLLNTSVETYLDWLLEGRFDYRGLIERGLALEAPEGMYVKKEEEK